MALHFCLSFLSHFTFALKIKVLETNKQDLGSVSQAAPLQRLWGGGTRAPVGTLANH